MKALGKYRKHFRLCFYREILCANLVIKWTVNKKCTLMFVSWVCWEVHFFAIVLYFSWCNGNYHSIVINEIVCFLFKKPCQVMTFVIGLNIKIWRMMTKYYSIFKSAENYLVPGNQNSGLIPLYTNGLHPALSVCPASSLSCHLIQIPSFMSYPNLSSCTWLIWRTKNPTFTLIGFAGSLKWS